MATQLAEPASGTRPETIGTPGTGGSPASGDRPGLLGAGFLYHCVPDFAEYYDRLLAVGGSIDIIEYLASHFASDPEYLGEVNRSLGDPPSTLHSFEYMIGSVDRPPDAVIRRMRRMVEVSNCRYIGEHVGLMGTGQVYTGTFLQPFGTDEQTQQFIDNLVAVKELAGCPLAIENQSQIYNQIGPRSMCEQIRDIAEGADVGVLLSLSNFMIAENFFPMDRERELAAIPLERVWQLHLPLGCAAELAHPDFQYRLKEETWARDTIEALFTDPRFRPSSIVFEIEDAGTPSHAEPERLRDSLHWARELLFKSAGRAPGRATEATGGEVSA